VGRAGSLPTLAGVHQFRDRHGRLRAPLLVTLFGVLFGVLAMHGLAVHSAAHGSEATAALPSEAVVAHNAGQTPDTHAADGHAPDAHAAHGHVGDTAVAVSELMAGHGDPGHDHTGEACLALLTLLVALMLSALQRGRPVRPLTVLPRAGSLLLPRGRPRDAPCLHALSILRC